MDERRQSRLLVELFCLGLFVCFLLIFYTMLIQKNYTVFTDRENVPEPAGFLADVSAYFE